MMQATIDRSRLSGWVKVVFDQRVKPLEARHLLLRHSQGSLSYLDVQKTYYLRVPRGKEFAIAEHLWRDCGDKIALALPASYEEVSSLRQR